MEELKKALELRAKYNNMDFDEFVKELEIYLGHKIYEHVIENWRYCGLNNTDMFFIIFRQLIINQTRKHYGRQRIIRK